MAGYEPPFPVGGQAVIEGVMMRAKHTLAIAVKRPDGSIVLKEDRLHTLAERYPVLRWPLVRGPVILLEALIYGIKALTFSAQASLDEEEEQLSPWSLFLTMVFRLYHGDIVLRPPAPLFKRLGGMVMGGAVDGGQLQFPCGGWHSEDRLFSAVRLVYLIYGGYPPGL